MKTEPDVFSIDDLKKRKTESWDGVRNYQARNFMRDEMKKNDLILIYHSSCKEVGISGVATVSQEAFADKTQFDKESKYYDEKATIESPRWFNVEVKYKKKLKRIITLKELKEQKKLSELALVKKGNRLSIMPITKNDFDFILSLE